jgi:hypothetical protein
MLIEKCGGRVGVFSVGDGGWWRWRGGRVKSVDIETMVVIWGMGERRKVRGGMTLTRRRTAYAKQVCSESKKKAKNVGPKSSSGRNEPYECGWFCCYCEMRAVLMTGHGWFMSLSR